MITLERTAEETSTTYSAGGAVSGVGGVGPSQLSFVDGSSQLGAGTSTPPPAPGPAPSIQDTSVVSSTSSAVPSFLRGAKHPGVCMAHLGFKTLALTSFIFGSFVFGGWNGDYVFTFVVTTLFLSLDFWTVKNVTGRILVGMRWWNNISEDGSSEWMYESVPDSTQIDSTDKTVFWAATYTWPLVWAVFLVIYIFRLDIETCLLVILGIVLSGANLVGYWRCSNDQKRRVSEWASTTAFKAVFSTLPASLGGRGGNHV